MISVVRHGVRSVRLLSTADSADAELFPWLYTDAALQPAGFQPPQTAEAAAVGETPRRHRRIRLDKESGEPPVGLDFSADETADELKRSVQLALGAQSAPELLYDRQLRTFVSFRVLLDPAYSLDEPTGQPRVFTAPPLGGS